MREKKDFEKLFIGAVDEGLNVLGESGRQMIFFHLERSYSIKRYEIPKKPEAFAVGLEKIFGAGASVLEKLILESLYSKLGLKYEDKSDYTFADYLNDIKEVKKTTNVRDPFPKKQAKDAEHFSQFVG